MIRKERVKTLLKGSFDSKKENIVYWMQSSIRYEYNHSLDLAINLSNEKGLPLIVVFYLDFSFPKANYRSFKFMLEGLKEVIEMFDKHHIMVKVILGKAEELIYEEIKNAQILIMDYGYLKYPRYQRQTIKAQCISKQMNITIFEVESDLLIPIHEVYPKSAYGARIIRPYVLKNMYYYRDLSQMSQINIKSPTKSITPFDFNYLDINLEKYLKDLSIKPYKKFSGGYQSAIKHLDYFLENKFKFYGNNDPSLDIGSYMSMYLHFGFISVLDILNRIDAYMIHEKITYDIYDKFIEQLLVRRTLSFNFVLFNPNYDDFYHMTENWAYETMIMHAYDQRPIIYTKNQIEYSQTDDIYFNAMMDEMRITGYMPNYLRMYWAKKIMEWQASMKDAYDLIVDLNDKYFIDGRDPNSYASIAWSFGKHDRAWQERSVFGKLRYMNQKGLESKFMMDNYLIRVENIKKDA